MGGARKQPRNATQQMMGSLIHDTLQAETTQKPAGCKTYTRRWAGAGHDAPQPRPGSTMLHAARAAAAMTPTHCHQPHDPLEHPTCKQPTPSLTPLPSSHIITSCHAGTQQHLLPAPLHPVVARHPPPVRVARPLQRRRVWCHRLACLGCCGHSLRHRHIVPQPHAPVVLLWPDDLGVRVRQRLPPVCTVTDDAAQQTGIQ